MPHHFQGSPGVSNLSLWDNEQRASSYVAHQIAQLIEEKQKSGRPAVLGLATGNTPKAVYQELVRLHRDEGLSFANVVSFNLDEYFPILPEDKNSYNYFMREYLFDHIDIQSKNIHIPQGDCASSDVFQFCKAYEDKISRYGGLDLQLLGIGRNGHIGFNEPGSSVDSTTRLVTLHPVTRDDAQSDFGTLDQVPEQAISMGVRTIVQAKRILLLALGERKSAIINQAIKGNITPEVPASLLRNLSHVEFVLDREAAALI